MTSNLVDVSLLLCNWSVLLSEAKVLHGNSSSALWLYLEGSAAPAFSAVLSAVLASGVTSNSHCDCRDT